MLNTYDELTKVENQVRSQIETTAGSNVGEKTTKWVGQHLGVKPEALEEYAQKSDSIPSDPREAFLFGAQMGVGFRENAEGITS